MIDTVILQIPKEEYEVIEHDKFTPRTTYMQNNKLPYFKYINNPKTPDKSRNNYMPRLTIHKRGYNFDLTVEFSAAKILFNNNLDELREYDFKEVSQRLREKILAMGVKVDKKMIENAKVLTFHPSKNILITNNYTSSWIINELSKIDITKKIDVTKVKFKNHGEELQFYTNSHSFVFYDKIADLKKCENRSTDKQQTKYQKSMFGRYNNKEILRFEVRLSDKKKMNETLRKLNYKSDPRFSDIFRKNVCKNILRLYWKDYFEDNIYLNRLTKQPQEILQLIIKLYPQMKIKEMIYLTGISLLCQDDRGIRSLRNIIQSNKLKTNWTKFSQDINEFNNSILTAGLYNPLNDIKNGLEKFQVMKSSDITN